MIRPRTIILLALLYLPLVGVWDRYSVRCTSVDGAELYAEEVPA